MRVLVTGASGFIGKNLISHLEERSGIEIVSFTRADEMASLDGLVLNVDFVFHLAGANRPKNVEDFKKGNTDLTSALCSAVKASGKRIPILYTSSIQAGMKNPYGESKLGAEDVLLELAKAHGTSVHIFRLPNVFGKWARPNYNSAVATFCYNISRDLPININDRDAIVNLVYIDDVIDQFVNVLDGVGCDDLFSQINPQYSISVGELADQLQVFHESRDTLVTDAVGSGLVRALYSTYVSYLSPERFVYEVPKYEDSRGIFVEMLKTHDSGQFSFFTAHPGITRGGHYHHSKTEKFLVIKGKANFRFRHIVTSEFHELNTSGEKPEIVETVPGWTHDITNIGNDEMIVMLWANEIFDRECPDTYAMPLVTEA